MQKRKKKKCADKTCSTLTYGRFCAFHEKKNRMERAKNKKSKKPAVKIPKEKQIKAKMPKPSILKKHAWDIMSIWIRLRDSDEKGFGKCCTCENVCYFYNDCFQAGHFRSRKFNYLMFNEINVNGQCNRCNGWGNGMTFEYGIFLNAKYGAGTAEELAASEKKPCVHNSALYLQKIREFADKAKVELSKKKFNREFMDKMAHKIDFYFKITNKLY